MARIENRVSEIRLRHFSNKFGCTDKDADEDGGQIQTGF